MGTLRYVNIFQQFSALTCSLGSWLTQFRQVFLLLCFCSICIDRVHDEWRLDTHNWTISTVHSLHLPGDQTVCHVTSARTAISFNTKGPKTSDNVHHTSVSWTTESVTWLAMVRTRVCVCVCVWVGGKQVVDQTTVRQGRGNQNIYELKMIFCIYFILLLTQLFVH